jgi:hypothetical protein
MLNNGVGFDVFGDKLLSHNNSALSCIGNIVVFIFKNALFDSFVKSHSLLI